MTIPWEAELQGQLRGKKSNIQTKVKGRLLCQELQLKGVSSDASTNHQSWGYLERQPSEQMDYFQSRWTIGIRCLHVGHQEVIFYCY